MAFPSAWLDELMAKNDIVSVISSYMELKPKGRKLWGLCPLHGEKTPSFSVSPDKQLFYCFGCHAGGSVIQFVMSMERLTFVEAVQELANRVGMEMPHEVNDRELARQRAYRDRLYQATTQAARYFHQCFVDEELGRAARSYATRRGLNRDIITRFGIGCAPEGWDNLLKHMTAQGFTQKELRDAGLLVYNQEKDSVYDAYRNRIIFPIIGTNGKVLGFGARVLNDDKPKYINTGDTPIYNKRNNLYGLYLHKNEKLDDLVMVEGYMDVIGLYQAGIPNAVASLGTALTQQQARLLKRYVETVYIAYDGDAAGQNATLRGLDILKSEGLEVRVIVFPDNLDPDEYVKIYGRDGFCRLKENALSLNAFKLEAMANGVDFADENAREQYATRACAFVAGLQPIEQERYYKSIARKTGYAMEALVAQGQRSGGILIDTNAKSTVRGTFRRRAEGEDDTRLLTERLLLQACVADKQAFLLAQREHAEERIESKPLRELFAALKQPSFRLLQYVGTLEQSEAEAVTAVFGEEGALQNATKTVEDCLRKLTKEAEQNRLQTLQAKLNQPNLSEAEKQAILKEITTIIRANK